MFKGPRPACACCAINLLSRRFRSSRSIATSILTLLFSIRAESNCARILRCSAQTREPSNKAVALCCATTLSSDACCPLAVSARAAATDFIAGGMKLIPETLPPDDGGDCEAASVPTDALNCNAAHSSVPSSSTSTPDAEWSSRGRTSGPTSGWPHGNNNMAIKATKTNTMVFRIESDSRDTLTCRHVWGDSPAGEPCGIVSAEPIASWTRTSGAGPPRSA
mmetsp:Transcript_112711/g.291245  ORF Transcript_112711/g.291245 Transcript_112711/m.291245 type:complete len:221 (-) Transcript_112711:7-669(-)